MEKLRHLLRIHLLSGDLLVHLPASGASMGCISSSELSPDEERMRQKCVWKPLDFTDMPGEEMEQLDTDQDVNGNVEEDKILVPTRCALAVGLQDSCTCRLQRSLREAAGRHEAQGRGVGPVRRRHRRAREASVALRLSCVRAREEGNRKDKGRRMPPTTVVYGRQFSSSRKPTRPIQAWRAAPMRRFRRLRRKAAETKQR